MFYQVKVLDDMGKIKKIVKSKELSRRHWATFYKEMSGESPFKIGKNKRRQKIGKKQDLAGIPALSH